MKIKAKFKGRNGSLGYENGKNYKLRFKIEYNRELGDHIVIHEIVSENVYGDVSLRKDSACPYSSLKSFLNNWQVF